MRGFFGKCAVLFLIIPASAWSDNNAPWFSGPLHENHPVTMPVGKGFVDFSSSSIRNRAFFDSDGNLVSTPIFSNNYYTIGTAYGLSDNTDFRVKILYTRNLVSGKSYSQLGDTIMNWGYQVFRQKNSRWLPDLRITIEETFPTGRWDHLNPNYHGSDATGAGSLQTALGIRVRKMISLPAEHFLVLHGRFVLSHPSSVSVNGLSIYGGSTTTQGKLTLGNSALVDLAAEYNFTKNWGGIFEWSIFFDGGSDFSGTLSNTGVDGLFPRFIFASGPGPRGFITKRIIRNRLSSKIIYNDLIPSNLNLGKQDIGNGNNLSVNLAPAIEYNFSANSGVVGGPNFNVMGRNTPVFMSVVLTLYKNW